MAKYLRVSLASLDGSVRMDGKPVAVRFGTEYPAEQSSQSFNPCPFPARAGDFGSKRRPNHAPNPRMEDTVLGAGRSLGLSGSRSAARSAAWAILSRTAPYHGGCQPMTAKQISTPAYREAATGSEISGRSAERIGWSFAATWATVTRCIGV